MAEIIQVNIRSESGFCSYDEAYKDKLVIKKNSIKYKYDPVVVTETNPVREWSYKTNSSIYSKIFIDISNEVNIILDTVKDLRCCDGSMLSFEIIFDDKTKKKQAYWGSIHNFDPCLKMIQKLVPNSEYIPICLLTENDYEE